MGEFYFMKRLEGVLSHKTPREASVVYPNK